MASRISRSIISKEGFLFKKGGIMKSWSRRYFVLSPQSLCYFRSELHEKLEPLGRIFLSDIVSTSNESTEKKKAFVFVLHTKKRAVLLQAANTEDREQWIESIKQASEIDKEAERKDPFRKSLRRLTPGLKRVTLIKDPNKGIGCTIKNAATHIFVHRILEDGPIAETGVLRPGDEILDIHGVSLSGKSVAEVVEVIRKAPTEFLATVRPVTSVHKALKKDFSRTNYVDVVHYGKQSSVPNGKVHERNGEINNHTSENGSYEYATVNECGRLINGRSESPTKMSNGRSYPPLMDSQPSYEDVGNYDDEDEGDVPPPLPPWTEDALIMVDPPPMSQKPRLNIYTTNAHLLQPISWNSRVPKVPLRLQHIEQHSQHSRHESFDTSLPSPMHKPTYSPPHIPPRPSKLLKCHSQDSLDQIDSRPPVPPRHQRTHYGYPSPGAKPRGIRHYEEIIDVKGAKYADLDFAHRHNYGRR